MEPERKVKASVRAPRWCKVFFWLVVTITLAAGLDPRGYHFRNEVGWLDNGPGLLFGRYGRVHTEPFLTPDEASQLNAKGFTIEAASTLTNLANGSFRLLATFHSGNDGSQLLVGQWRQFLVVMNGDDYNHSRKFPRLTAEIPPDNSKPSLLAITTGPGGTRIYLDGKRVAYGHGLHLILPSLPESARLTLGASVHASNPWQADLRGFALIPKALDGRAIADEFNQWNRGQDFSFAAADDPLLLYSFADRATQTITNSGKLNVPLAIPSRLWALGRRALAPLAQHDNETRAGVEDSAVNLFGFLPFGIALTLLLNPEPGTRLRTLFLVTLSGGLLSLFIELYQAWIPSRDSSLQDFLLNTIGGSVGAVICTLLLSRVRLVFGYGNRPE